MHTYTQQQKTPTQSKSNRSSKTNSTVKGSPNNVNTILQLQRTIGNKAVQRLLRRKELQVKTDTTTQLLENEEEELQAKADNTFQFQEEEEVMDAEAAEQMEDKPSYTLNFQKISITVIKGQISGEEVIEWKKHKDIQYHYIQAPPSEPFDIEKFVPVPGELVYVECLGCKDPYNAGEEEPRHYIGIRVPKTKVQREIYNQGEPAAKSVDPFATPDKQLEKALEDILEAINRHQKNIKQTNDDVEKIIVRISADIYDDFDVNKLRKELKKSCPNADLEVYNTMEHTSSMEWNIHSRKLIIEHDPVEFIEDIE